MVFSCSLVASAGAASMTVRRSTRESRTGTRGGAGLAESVEKCEW
jgi:hypothetical protein